MRFVVFIEYTDMAARERALPEHRAYLKAGRDSGVVTECGPFLDGKGGLYLLHLENEAAARAFIAADPYSKAGLKLTLRAWRSSRDAAEN